MPIAQPQAITMSGVRQLETLEAVRSSPAVVDMQMPLVVARGLEKEAARVGYRELMHSHENPIRPSAKSFPALQRCNLSRSDQTN
jgi:hypothetical protein